MTDFEYEVMQRKRIARNAKYRKCGSKSKKCFLPSDHMTPKQWKERNGKVSTVKMNEPMSWSEFKTLSEDIQSEYLNKLIRRFNVTATVIAKEMFGINNQYLCSFVRNRKLNVKFQKGVTMSDRERDAWESFLNPAPEKREAAESSVEENISVIAEEPIKEPELTMPEAATEVCAFDPNGVLAMIGCKKPICSTGTQMSQFSFLFEGELDTNMIMNSVRGILGEGRTGKLQVIYEQ